MWKIAGAALVLSACSIAGFSLANQLRSRTRELADLQFGLILLEAEIRHGSTPLPEALESLLDQVSPQVGNLFNIVRRKLVSGSSFSGGQAWTMALDEWSSTTNLEKKDLKILEKLSPGLGMAPMDEQLKRIHMVIQRLAAAELEARDQQLKNGKLWSYSGVLVGMVLALIAW